MAFDNSVTVVGNVTRDPELRFTPSGAAVATFGLAWNRRSTNARGETEEQVSFFDVTCWRQLAENVAESLAKGSRVVVYGRLEQRSWETNDGEKRSKVEIIADDVAPSLRWATATITRNDFREGSGGDFGGGGGGGGNRGGGGGGRSSGGGGGGNRPAPNEPYDTDEEPF
jgi:single-strand DNA-binding protein